MLKLKPLKVLIQHFKSSISISLALCFSLFHFLSFPLSLSLFLSFFLSLSFSLSISFPLSSAHFLSLSHSLPLSQSLYLAQALCTTFCFSIICLSSFYVSLFPYLGTFVYVCVCLFVNSDFLIIYLKILALSDCLSFFLSNSHLLSSSFIHLSFPS